MKNLKLYKQYTNLPKFDDGNPTSSNYNGRRLGYNYLTGLWNGYNIGANNGTDTTSTDVSGFSATPAQSLQPAINQLALLNSGSTMNLISNVGNAAVTSAPSIAAITNPLSKVNFANPITGKALSLEGSKALGSTATSTIGNVLGAAGGLAGAAMGGILFGQGLRGFKNVLGDNVLGQASSYGTELIGDTTYRVNNGYDQQQVDEYGNKQISNAKLLTTLGGLGTGMGVGAAAGSIGALAGMGTGAAAGSVLPGLGTAIGAGVGLLAGGIASIFGGKSAKEKIAEAKRNYAMEQSATNMLNEAVAGNEAAKLNYYADKGKATGQDMRGIYTGKMTTPQGYLYGKIEGLASPDEGMIDMSTGETNYLGNPMPGTSDPRQDTVPVGGEGFNENVAIPGHQPDLTDPYGRSFADQARPYFKVNEMIKLLSQQEQLKYQQLSEENQNHKYRNDTTKEYMLKRYDLMYQLKMSQFNEKSQEATQNIANITQKLDMLKKYLQQGDMLTADGGKTYLRKFLDGWSVLLPQDNYNNYNWYLYNPWIVENPLVQKDLQNLFKPVGLLSNEIDSPKIDNIPLNAKYTPKNFGGKLKDFYNNSLSPFFKQNGSELANIGASLYGLINENNITKDMGNLTMLNVQNTQANKALRELDNLRYNPDASLLALANQDRQNLYNIRNASNLSAGQKVMLANQAANQNRLSRYTIAADAFNKNAGYRTAYANALMQAGEAQAQRDWNAQSLYEQQRIAQNASYVTNRLNHYKNVMSQFGNITKNFDTRQYNDRMLDLYDRRLKEDLAKRLQDAEIAARNQQQYLKPWSPAGTTSIDDALKATAPTFKFEITNPFRTKNNKLFG